MTIELVLPFGDKKNVKNLVFSILSHEYPLKIIQLTNYIKKRYGLSVTFQGVRKAVLHLVDSGVLEKINNEFQINVDWVKESKTSLDKLYLNLTSSEMALPSLDSIGSEISVFTFNSLNDLMKFWQSLIDDWFKKFKKSDYKFNYYQANHSWEVLLHLETEEKIMGQLKKKGIRSKILVTGNTLLDKNIARFYNGIGVKTIVQSSKSSFDKSFHVGTYGDLIIQTTYPKDLVDDLDYFFNKNKTLDDLDLSKLLKIVTKKREMKLTVIKNLEMVKQINNSIESQFVD